MIIGEKDEYYLELAKSVSHGSKCHYWHSGAVLVKDNCVISVGYNGSYTSEIDCRKTGICTYEDTTGKKADGSQEKCYCICAEISAILNMGNLQGSTLYVYREDPEGHKLQTEISPFVSHILQASGISRIVL